MRRFSEYSDIEKDEIRKQGIRTLTYAYKQGKSCALCGWANIHHLWLAAPHRTARSDASWVPLDRVPQKYLLQELDRRMIICAACRRLNPPPRPKYTWHACVKQLACISCGLVRLRGWARLESQRVQKSRTKRGPLQQVTVESRRCCRCQRKMDARVKRAKQFNKKQKNRASQCQTCGIKVCDLGGAAFDWDHLDRTLKSGNVGSMVLSGEHIGPIRAEIDKCRLLCVHCHLDHTSQQLGYGDPIPKIKEALKKAKIRAFNDAPLDLCSDSES